MAIASILTSIKKTLNLPDLDTSFDEDIILHVNSVFADLNQLGIGPADGFAIEDKTTTWDAFLGTDKRKNNVKSYMFLRVRILFDPPSTAHLTASYESLIRELTWRINAYREDTEWVDPDPDDVVSEEDLYIDGGGA
jgi:hypothetical protein